MREKIVNCFDLRGTKRKLYRKENRKGFTLVELIVVIVILAILAAILIPGLLKWIDKAREKKYEAEARNIYLATEASIVEVYSGGFGSNLEGLMKGIGTGKNHFTLPGNNSADNSKWFAYIEKMSEIDNITEIRIYISDNKMRALRINYISPSDGKEVRATINERGYDYSSSGDKNPPYNDWKADDGLWHFTYR